MSPADAIDFYVGVLEASREEDPDALAFADDLEDVLRTRVEIERAGSVPVDRLREADEHLIRQAQLSDEWGAYLARQGSEWPWRLHQIAQGTFPLDQIPPHIRELARSLYYS